MNDNTLDNDQRHPLIKEVPDRLFEFEEKLFGLLTLQQFFLVLAAALGILTLTHRLPLVPRVLVCAVVVLLALILALARPSGYSLAYWCYVYVRFWTLPRVSVWRSALHRQGAPRRGTPGSVQDAWVQLNLLAQGIMGHTFARRGREQSALWVVFELAQQTNPRYLPFAEQVRLNQRYQSYLDGLGFALKELHLVERCDPEQDAALLVQRQAITRLAAAPHLQTIQQASYTHQQQLAHQQTTVRHLLVVAATSKEVAQAQHKERSQLPFARLIPSRQAQQVSKQQVLDLLRIRVSSVKGAMRQLDVQATLLDDVAALSAYVSSMALGTHMPSFEVAVEPASGAREGKEQAGTTGSHDRQRQPSPSKTRTPARTRTITQQPSRSTKHHGRQFQKRVKGLHGSCTYLSSHERTHLEAGLLHLPDLVAPSAVRILPEAVEITVGEQRRFQRSYELTGYGSSLACGWLETVTSLGLPMAVMTRYEPIDTTFMIRRLELQLTKLAGQRLADGKSQRITHATQQAEAEHVQKVIDALARKKLRIFAVQVIVTIHAASLEALEQRGAYLLSHLREMQLGVRQLTRRHDIGWQASLLSGLPAGLDCFKNLGSDVLSSFMHWSTGSVGTPSGAYLGTTGTENSRRPVYLNPWDTIKKLANPHIVVVGETGMGKSWLIKTLILGLLALGIDVVVLDRDGDYDEIHTHLGPRESQRISLARGCPINPLGIPFGPDDVRQAEATNLLAEFIDNSVLAFLAMLLTAHGFSPAEEAFVAQVVRACFAAKGFTDEAILRDPAILLGNAPVLADLIQAMREAPTSSESMRQSFLERLLHVAHLFPLADTAIGIATPLTVFSIKGLDEKWYPLMIYTVQNFLRRHRALKRDERYLAYVIEEASYMFKHPAAKRYLEAGSRGFRKQGIAQIVISQLPRDFLEEGQVIMSNAGTTFFLGMQRYAVEKLGLPEELERILLMGSPGQAVMRCGREYAQLSVASNPALRALLTTDPEERRQLAQRESRHAQPTTLAS